MAIRTLFTELFQVAHPLVLAPMGGVSGGALAAAVSEAGGLGLVGGGSVIRAGWSANCDWWPAHRQAMGVGVITWAVGEDIVRLALSYGLRPSSCPSGIPLRSARWSGRPESG